MALGRSENRSRIRVLQARRAARREAIQAETAQDDWPRSERGCAFAWARR